MNGVKEFLAAPLVEQIGMMKLYGMRVKFTEEERDNEVSGNVRVVFTKPIDVGLREAMLGVFVQRMEEDVEVTQINVVCGPNFKDSPQ